MNRVHACLPLTVPAADVWDLVAPFDALATWHPGVLASPVAGAGIGAVRTVILPDGMRLSEQLTEWDPAGRLYRYRMLDGGMPVRNYLATLMVVDCGEPGCRLEWRAGFEAIDDADGEGFAAMLGEAFCAGLAGVHALLRPNAG